MGLKINFKFEILGILVQNPNIQQAFPKRFSDFAQTFFIISSEKKMRSISGKNYKSFLSEKNPTSIFKIGGILLKKNIPQMA